MVIFIYHLVSTGVLAFFAYIILYTINYKMLAKLVVMVTVVTMITTVLQDLTPVYDKFNARVDSLQKSADRISGIGKIKWHTPIKGTITQKFEVDGQGKEHHGIDWGADEGTFVEATEDGQVVKVEWSNIYGNTIVIDHGNGLESLYGHLQGLSVKKGYPVYKGQKIGTCGNTGNSKGNHLHFEIRKNGICLDPMDFL